MVPLFPALLLALGGAAMAAVDDRCLMVDSCYFKMEPKTCSCQPDCHLYGTCCLGAGKGPHPATSPSFLCYGRRAREALFVRRSCRPGYLGHPHDNATCMDDDEDKADLVNNLLVTSRVTKVTYWNKQCAKCNDEDMKNLEFWDVVVECGAIKGVNKAYVRKHLAFYPDRQQWGTMVGELFIRCNVHYSPPASLDNVKHCNRNLVESCPPEYPDRERSRKCSDSYAERKLKSGDVYFRNVHCAICNGFDERDVECAGMWSGPEADADEGDFLDVKEVVFTGGEWLHREPGRQYECSPGYVYDPFRGRCRTYKLEGGGDIVVSSAPVRGGGAPLLLLATLSVVLLL